MCVDWYGPTEVSEGLTASIFTVLHSSWTAVRWRQKAGPNHDTYATYTLRRPRRLAFSSEILRSYIFQWVPSPVLNLTEIFQERNVANHVREIRGICRRQRGVYETKAGDILSSRHVSSCDVNACSWDVRGDLTLNSMAQIHTSATLLTSRDLAWSSGRLTCQHASQISAVAHIS